MHRRNRRRGFIIIFGSRTISTRERASEVQGRCPHCGEDEARLIGRARRRWFTLFFIPVIPMETSAHRISQCRECKQMFDMPIEEFARRGGSRGGNDFSESITLYNQLRERPDDGKLMLQLLKTYEQIGEPGEAESAARHYPKAFAAEPQCAVVLERMRRGMK
ncbi:MAG TPA: zinc-ribbon domain-containing protein [Humisphaera sp.]|jgi:hypothetical protein|nr:zinc-ribbon domain-containing protein [Humisphaera sp.]